MYLFEDFLMFRLAVVRLFLLTGPFSPSSSSSSPRFDQNRKTQMWKMWCISWSQKARLVITSDNHSQSTKLLHKYWLGSGMMKLCNISQPWQPGNAYKEWKHRIVYSQLRKECGCTIQRKKYQLSAARLVYNSRRGQTVVHGWWGSLSRAYAWILVCDFAARSGLRIFVLGFMHQPDEPKSLSSWEEVGNPLILHNNLHVSIVCLCTCVCWQVVIVYRYT